MTTDSPPPPRRAGAKWLRHRRRAILAVVLVAGAYVATYVALRASGRFHSATLIAYMNTPRGTESRLFVWILSPGCVVFMPSVPPYRPSSDTLWLLFSPLGTAESKLRTWWVN